MAGQKRILQERLEEAINKKTTKTRRSKVHPTAHNGKSAPGKENHAAKATKSVKNGSKGKKAPVIQ